MLRTRALCALLAGFLCVLASQADASHFRYSHITWRPTGAPGEVVFTISSAFRRGAPGTHPLSYIGTASDGGLTVGDTFTEYIGATRLYYGDGGSTTTLTYQVDAINTVEDWIIAHALNPATGAEWRHTYVGTGPFTAGISSCCRTAVEINNPNRSYKVSTIVDLSVPNSSPVSSVTPIVPCPQGACILPLPSVDVDADALSFRLSTFAESGLVQPGSGTADPLNIGAAGVLAWDSTNFPKGLYSTSVTLEESRGGPLGKVMLDFLINTDTFLGAAPQFVVPPTPANAQVFNLTGGNLFSTTIQCADADGGDLVTLGHLGLPTGATMSPTNAIGNPATATFEWTPIATQVATVGLTCIDTLGNQALPHSFSMIVTGVIIPPGPDRDNDFFCDGFSINQLIAGWGGTYNVIDNSLQPSAVLIGTSGPDLILASGLGDQIFGFGGDDCIIGADANDYVSGGDGDDSIWGWSGDDVLEGDAGDDELDGRDGNDFLLGGAGNDVMRGVDNEDWMRGGPGDDVLRGGDDIDGMDGDAGNDQLFAGAGEDALAGGTGIDTLDGGVGADVCVNDGVDTLVGCLVLRPQNTAPRFSPSIGDQVTDESTPLSLTIVADDPDPPGIPEQGGVLTFSAVNLPLFATLTDNLDRTATLDIVPQPGDAGSYPGIVIKVTDDLEPFQVDVEVVDITVTGGNLPPSLSAIGSHAIVEGESLSLLITGSDLDPGDTLTFVATGLPPFATLTDHGNRTATLDIQPGPGDAAQYHGIQIRVLDDGVPILSDDEIFSIVVSTTANAAPVITTPVSAPTIQVGGSLAIALMALDPDPGDVLTWSSQNLPTFATLTDLGGGAALLQLQPAAGDEGSYLANVVEVADDGVPALTDAEVFTITVTTTPPANSPPVLTTPIGSPSLQQGEVLVISLAASDPDLGDILTWSSQNLPAFATLTDLGGGTALLAIEPAVGDGGTYTGNLVSVTDDGAPPLADAEIFTITVTTPVCSDGNDNDGDGLTDFPADPGCRDANWTFENPKCNDGIDNDGDGLIDWDGGGAGAPDPQCNQAWRNREKAAGGSCGVGFELIGILPPLLALRRRRRITGRRR